MRTSHGSAAKSWLVGIAVVALGAALAPMAQTAPNPAADPAPVISDANLDEWLAYVRPAPEELAYTEIEWRPTLWEALVEANKVDRPVLLWTMNGHPLGCT